MILPILSGYPQCRGWSRGVAVMGGMKTAGAFLRRSTSYGGQERQLYPEGGRYSVRYLPAMSAT